MTKDKTQPPAEPPMMVNSSGQADGGDELAIRRRGKPKEWSLRAPDGTEYLFRNLSSFLRDNANLFRPDDLVSLTKARSGPSRAYMGLSRLRPTGRASAQWEGWKWADPAPPRPVSKRAGGTWALRAPDGVEYRFQNLSAFVQENSALFGAADLAPYGKGLQCRAMVSLRQL